MLDDVDRALIGLLQADGRAGVADLGQAVGLSPSAANERVRKLLARGALRGIVALADPLMLGLGIAAFVTVTLSPGADEAGFVEAVLADGAILECHHVTGPANYLLKVRVADMAGLEALLRRLKTTGALMRSETQIALSSPKETTALPVGGA
ncbi:Lrp/AsnC family transcriptional regulator [Zavarzinia aquatilis]|uniref:Lrp/AsnC family transcriptional regulator n=1 Tax=Zavarzinia aquatilis TaxID=2211142 RepID=A0A317E9G0_9PROT|nr:Lrp/AsnC family transcriptional regulator [Zavarzinia aquatilis]PWR22780.1 Lrp/AsnC family transcriptional regulator [Zavarzinia aquatilis]